MSMSVVTLSRMIGRILVLVASTASGSPTMAEAPFDSAFLIRAMFFPTAAELMRTGSSPLDGAKFSTAATSFSQKPRPDRLVHDDHVGAHAHLADVEERAHGALGGRVVQVGILPHDGGGPLPPSSSTTGFRCWPASFPMMRPTGVLPVKLIFLTSGLAMSDSVTSAAAEAVVRDHVDDAGGQPCLPKGVYDSPHALGRQLRSL